MSSRLVPSQRVTGSCLYLSPSLYWALRRAIPCELTDSAPIGAFSTDYSERFYNFCRETMKTHFFDLLDNANPLNGNSIENLAELQNLLESVRDRLPFIAELIGDNGFKLTFVLGTTEGCVQFCSVELEPPYLMAVNPNLRDSEGEVEFLMGGALTPVSKRYCLHYDAFVEIAAEFVQTGERKRDVLWEELGP
jgi:Immunity protein Imm1